MKPEHQDYLGTIGIVGALQERAKQIALAYETHFLLPDDTIESIFVDDRLDADNSRAYMSLWFFTKKAVCEAKSFISLEVFDMAPYLGGISYWRLTSKGLLANDPAASHKLDLSFSMHHTTSAEMHATGNNCPYLLNILRRHIIPNVPT